MPCLGMERLKLRINAWDRCPDCNHVAAVHGHDLICDICSMMCAAHARLPDRRSVTP